MVARAACGFLVLEIVLLAGCAGAGGDPPQRPVASVTDRVGAVDRDLVVGTWQCRELNPYPELPEQTIATTYQADGAFVSESRSAPRPPLGAMLITARGRWSVDGGHIATSDVETAAGSADGDAWTNLMAQAGASIMNSFGGSETRSTSEVLELDRSELLLRPVGVEDPPVIACSH